MRNKSPQTLVFLQPPPLSTSGNFFYVKLSIIIHTRESNFLCDFTLYLYGKIKIILKKTIFDHLKGAKRENLSWNIIKI